MCICIVMTAYTRNILLFVLLEYSIRPEAFTRRRNVLGIEALNKYEIKLLLDIGIKVFVTR